MRTIVIEVYTLDEKKPGLHDVCQVFLFGQPFSITSMWNGDGFVFLRCDGSVHVTTDGVVEWSYSGSHCMEPLPRFDNPHVSNPAPSPPKRSVIKVVHR